MVLLTEVTNGARTRPFWFLTLIASSIILGSIGLLTIGFAMEYGKPVSTVVPETVEAVIDTDGYIKVPLDIDRRTDCLVQSTVFLARDTDYGGNLGTRQDLYRLTTYNTSITNVGVNKVMLWFDKPELPQLPGWSYYARVQDDCGSFWNWSARPSGRATVRKLVLRTSQQAAAETKPPHD